MHPHIAEISNSLMGNAYQGRSSPLFNRPNQQWDLGEGFAPDTDPHYDYGGYLGFDDGEHLELDDIRVTQGWHLYVAPNGATLWRFVGFLLPKEIPLPPPPAAPVVGDAAFELFATYPATIPTTPPLVAIDSWSTTGDKRPDQCDPNQYCGRFAYPGETSLGGLWASSQSPDGIRRPSNLSYDLPTSGPAYGFAVIAGYVVPRTGVRPLPFQMQRNLQLAKVIELLLETPPTSPLHPPGFDVPGPDGVPVLIAGTSFGGAVSQLSVLLFPEVFHGAFDGSLSASLRRAPAEQEAWRYINTRSALHPDGSTYGIRDALEWPTFIRQVELDFFNASFTRRFVDGQAQRPVLFWIGDEDTVTSGTDWAPLLSGQRAYPQPGYFSNTSGNSTVHYAVVDRRCHQGGWFTSPFSPHVTTTDPTVMVLEFLPDVAASHQSNPVPPPMPFLADDGSEDPHDHAFTRAWADPPAQSALVLDPAFGVGGRTAGQGVMLGNDESLRVHAGAIFVGSADGVVTRFVRNAGTNELDVAARSPVLGYGAAALAVGDADVGRAGDEVVVGTFRHVYMLDATTLAVVRSQDFSSGDAYEFSRPRRMQIADVFGAAIHDGPEILFNTMYGHLVVLGAQLQVLADYPEPGIQDQIAHETLTNPDEDETASQVLITLLSHRGHVANVTLDAEPDPTQHVARLQAWTDDQIGNPFDIEAFDVAGQQRIAALYAHGDINRDDTIRLFDAKTLAPLGNVATDVGALRSPPRVLDMAVTKDVGGSVHYVVINPPEIFLIDSSGAFIGRKRLGSFAPALNAIAVAVADIVPGNGTNFTDEVIVSTEGGHVVHFPVEQLTTAGDDLGLPRVVGNDMPHTNRAVVATWGMISRDVCQGMLCGGGTLQVVDQTGTRWHVDGSGNATFVHEMRVKHPTLPRVGDPVFPIRDLVALDTALGGTTVASADLVWHPPIPNHPANSGYFECFPWQNGHLIALFLAPQWARYPLPPPDFTIPPNMYVYPYDNRDYVALPMAGAALANGAPVGGATGQLHFWGGERTTYPNLVQGVFFDGSQITRWWGSSLNEPAGDSGRANDKNKDLRNVIREPEVPMDNLGSLRLIADAQGQPLLVASTAGGSVVLMRPGQNENDHGTILWDSADGGTNLDYGFGGMGLAVRAAPGDPTKIDVFLGVAHHHTDPAPHMQPIGQGRGPGSIVGAVRWLRWDGTTMTEHGALLVLDPDPNASPPERGGYAVCGLAVGDLLPGSGDPDELVVTTLDGDVFVYALGATGIGARLFRTWVEGSAGAYNSIVIDDVDLDGNNELYVAGSMGIWKFKRP